MTTDHTHTVMQLDNMFVCISPHFCTNAFPIFLHTVGACYKNKQSPVLLMSSSTKLSLSLWVPVRGSVCKRVRAPARARACVCVPLFSFLSVFYSLAVRHFAIPVPMQCQMPMISISSTTTKLFLAFQLSPPAAPALRTQVTSHDCRPHPSVTTRWFSAGL